MLLSASWQSFGSKVGRCQYRAVVQWAMGTLGVGTLAEGGRVKGRDRWGVEFEGLREGWVKVRGRLRDVVSGVRSRTGKKSRREGIFLVGRKIGTKQGRCARCGMFKRKA